MNAGGPAVLLVGPGNGSSGFGRVVANLLPRLARRWQVWHLATDRSQDSAGPGWRVLGNRARHDPYAVLRLADAAERLRPIVIAVQDLAVMSRYVSAVHAVRGVRFVAYCPVDGRIDEPRIVGWAGQADRVVVYTHWARDQVLEASARLLPPRPAPRMAVIGHGTDLAFRPVTGVGGADSRTLARRQLRLPDDGTLLVLVVGRHQPRKRLDLAIDAFARFASTAGRPARLVVHTGDRRADDVRSLAEAAGVRSLLAEPAINGDPDTGSDGWLNLLYNACDVGLSTSSGESWGLASFEHAATGAPQILVETPSAAELWGDSAVRIPGTGPMPLGPTMSGIAADPAATAGALGRLAGDAAALTRMGALAMSRARRPDADWDAVAQQWHRLLGAVAREPARRQAA